MKTIDIITMGCSKNLVDSERLMGRLEQEGFTCTHDSNDPQGEIAIISTCGFIEDAKQESINTILQFAQRKEKGTLERLYVMGCLSQKYKKELEAEIPQVDKYFGKFNFMDIIAELVKKGGGGYKKATRHITTPPHYAYLKISEGCDRQCAYCAIPAMTGKHVSRPMDDILEEVRTLASKGVKEFQVIAQELTYYGTDIDGHQHIAELISKMADIKGVEWIRLHYAYPADFPYDLLKVMRERDNVCKYLDIALQHISDKVLARMHRHITKEQTYALIERLRKEVPGIHLRTTLMVGFPGEAEEDFSELMDFVSRAQFERMGAFTYSEEDNTYSATHYKDDVPKDVKTARLDRIMALQQRISARKAEECIGKTMKVIIDRKEGDYYIGRTEYSSPEVDPEVLLPADNGALEIGQFYNATITDSEYFDLFAKVNMPERNANQNL